MARLLTEVFVRDVFKKTSLSAARSGTILLLGEECERKGVEKEDGFGNVKVSRSQSHGDQGRSVDAGNSGRKPERGFVGSGQYVTEKGYVDEIADAIGMAGFVAQRERRFPKGHMDITAFQGWGHRKFNVHIVEAKLRNDLVLIRKPR